MNTKSSAKQYILCFALLFGVANLAYAVSTSPANAGFNSEAGAQNILTLKEASVSGESFTAGAIAMELLLLDGTSIVLAPGAEIDISSYRFDKNTLAGHLELQINKGLVRVIGGALNNRQSIAISTTTSQLALRNGAAMIEVDENQETRTSLIFGERLSMHSGGKTKQLVRAGYELVSRNSDQPPEGPQQLPSGEIATRAFVFNPLVMTNDEEGVLALAQNTQQAALSSDDRQTDSGTTGGGGPDAGGDPGTGPTPPGPTPPVEPPAEIPGRPDALAGNTSDGFGPGLGVDPANISDDQPSQANADSRMLAQLHDNGAFVHADDTFQEPTRSQGRTTNRLFNGNSAYTQLISIEGPEQVSDKTLNNSEDPPVVSSENFNLGYVFWNDEGGLDAGLSLSIDSAVTYSGLQHRLNGGSAFNQDAPFLLLGIDVFPADGGVFPKSSLSTVDDSNVGQGSILTPASQFHLLQAGFYLVDRPSRPDETFPITMIERNPDNFLLLQARPGRIVDSVPELDPDRTEQFIFAAGDIDDRLPANGFTGPQFSVDRFFLSAGLQNFDQKDSRTVAEDIRAFLRAETGLGLDLYDSGVMVVNPASEGGDEQTALVHADFGLSGVQGDQQSTISVTIGEVDYQLSTCSSCDIQESIEAVVSGQTIGSSQGDINFIDDSTTSVSRGTVGFSSPLRSTAAGGGNPALDRPGYAGYFLLENYDPDPLNSSNDADGNAVSDAPLLGGTERPIGNGADTQQYAYLRLATATGEDDTGSRTTTSLNGWAAGLADVETDGGVNVVQIDTDVLPTNFSLQTNADTNRVQADIAFFDHNAIQLGGLTGDSKGASAFVDDNRYAARSSVDSEFAIISSDLVRDGLPTELQTDYQHLQWGFFFGDTNLAAGQREHVHLGTWVAGKVPDSADMALQGTASYSGHAIGNVFTNGAHYTAVGNFTNTWDFDQDTSAMTLEFDGATYNGSPTRSGSNFRSGLESTGREGSLYGNFVDDRSAADLEGGFTPQGVTGRFSINEREGAAYRASGTFAGER